MKCDSIELVIWEAINGHLDNEEVSADITSDVCSMLKQKFGFEYDEEKIPHMY